MAFFPPFLSLSFILLAVLYVLMFYFFSIFCYIFVCYCPLYTVPYQDSEQFSLKYPVKVLLMNFWIKSLQFNINNRRIDNVHAISLSLLWSQSDYSEPQSPAKQSNWYRWLIMHKERKGINFVTITWLLLTRVCLLLSPYAPHQHRWKTTP